MLAHHIKLLIITNKLTSFIHMKMSLVLLIQSSMLISYIVINFSNISEIEILESM